MNPRLRPACFCLVLIGLLSAPPPLLSELPAGLQQQTAPNSEVMREIRHRDPQWESVRLHLPDPAIATEEQLETVADVLRARRFPEDALDYYLYALKRGGGNQVMLMNRIGVTQLELRHTAAARAYFQRAIQLQKKDPDARNNLGAAEYMNGRLETSRPGYSLARKRNN